MYNLNGQEVLYGSVTSGETIDISSLHKGAYFMHLRDGKGTSIQRLIKQ